MKMRCSLKPEYISALLLAVIMIVSPVNGQVSKVITLADSLVGGVGGISVDRMGNVFSADFMDTVWRIRPDGRVEKFASGFYGASGNAIDKRGYLYQANFYGNYISRVDRHGKQSTWVDTGLNGPVGLAIDSQDVMYVNNCSNNTIGRIGPNRVATTFASSELLKCPNGITFGPDSSLYVVNFRDGNMLKVTMTGAVQLFATIPGGGNGHVAFARGNFYVTAFQSNRIYQVSIDGKVTIAAGTGQFGEVDGEPEEAVFTFPNGIAATPSGNRLFVNDYVNRTPPNVLIPPVPFGSLRMIMLATITDLLSKGLRENGIQGMEAAYRRFKSDPSTAKVFTERAVNTFGYTLMNQGLLDATVHIMLLNANSYPDSFNAWDSLAEAYMKKGDNKMALQNYHKSLELNPSNTNAQEMIAKIKK